MIAIKKILKENRQQDNTQNLPGGISLPRRGPGVCTSRKKEAQEVPIITIEKPDSELVDIPQYTRYSLHHTFLRLSEAIELLKSLKY